MGTGYQVLTKEVMALRGFEDIVRLREDPYHRAFAISYARPPGKPDAGVGKAAPWKLYWKQSGRPKPEKDGGAMFFEFLEMHKARIPGRKNLEAGVRHLIKLTRQFNPKGKMRVYNGLMYNEKQIALMEAKEKGLTKM